MPVFELKNGKKIVFIHVPKTGGTTIEKWLMDCCDRFLLFSKSPPEGLRVTPQHLSLNSVRILLDFDVNTYSFTIVRNPYDRMESEFFYRKNFLKSFSKKRKGIDFSKWVIESLKNVQGNPFYYDNHLQKQCSFLGEGIDVFKFEDGLENIATRIALAIGIDLPVHLGKHKISDRKPVVWSKRAIQQFNEFYQEDFDTFGYPFRSVNTGYRFKLFRE